MSDPRSRSAESARESNKEETSERIARKRSERDVERLIYLAFDCSEITDPTDRSVIRDIAIRELKKCAAEGGFGRLRDAVVRHTESALEECIGRMTSSHHVSSSYPLLDLLWATGGSPPSLAPGLVRLILWMCPFDSFYALPLALLMRSAGAADLPALDDLPMVWSDALIPFLSGFMESHPDLAQELASKGRWRFLLRAFVAVAVTHPDEARRRALITVLTDRESEPRIGELLNENLPRVCEGGSMTLVAELARHPRCTDQAREGIFDRLESLPAKHRIPCVAIADQRIAQSGDLNHWISVVKKRGCDGLNVKLAEVCDAAVRFEQLWFVRDQSRCPLEVFGAISSLAAMDHTPLLSWHWWQQRMEWALVRGCHPELPLTSKDQRRLSRPAHFLQAEATLLQQMVTSRTFPDPLAEQLCWWALGELKINEATFTRVYGHNGLDRVKLQAEMLVKQLFNENPKDRGVETTTV